MERVFFDYKLDPSINIYSSSKKKCKIENSCSNKLLQFFFFLSDNIQEQSS